jgi:hypothetical protein
VGAHHHSLARCHIGTMTSNLKTETKQKQRQRQDKHKDGMGEWLRTTIDFEQNFGLKRSLALCLSASSFVCVKDKARQGKTRQEKTGKENVPSSSSFPIWFPYDAKVCSGENSSGENSSGKKGERVRML